jgi:GT2 family glycosyltransferase
VFVDADSHPSRELFAEVAQQIKRGDCLAGGSTVRIDDPHLVGQLGTRLWNIISRMRGWAAGSFIFCQTNAFREIGGFSQELFASEEIDLSTRLKKLAKARGQHFRILHRHPLLTSGRKLHLYSRREHARFLRRVLFCPRQTVRQRESCSPWYDGRR